MPTLTYSYTFAPGGLIRSSEVNANFDAIATLVNGLLDATNLANAAVTENKLANLAVTTGKIADAAVTNAKVAAGIDAAKIGAGSVSNTEYGYLDGVTSALQTQLDEKQAAGSPAVTATELGYLAGASSNVQTQISARALAATTIAAGSGLTGGGSLAANRTISVATGGITASMLDSQAVGADPVFASDTSETLSVLTEAVPAGVWYIGDASPSLEIAVTLNAGSRIISTVTTGAVLVISDGTNVTLRNNHLPAPIGYRRRRVYP